MKSHQRTETKSQVEEEVPALIVVIADVATAKTHGSAR